MELQLRDRVFVITGGGRGLGRATASALVADGARVVISGRDATTLEHAVDALGPNAVAIVADNADEDTPARLVARAREAWGRLDGALISVGGPPTGSALEATDEQWTAAFGSVFLGAVRLARELAAELDEDGSITFVLSSSVKSPVANLAISNGLRPGLAMVAKTLADELGPRGIRVNGLLPGRVGTERVAELDASTGDSDAARTAMTGIIPLRRYGAPAEFGRVAAFLMSPGASYITGAMIPVDGGMLRTV